MASKKQVLIILLLSLITLSFIINPSHAVDCPETIPGGKIAVYWGQHNSVTGEGTLAEACDSGLYNIVALAYLSVSGDTRDLELADCSSDNCKDLAPDIKHCQRKGIQVFLSVIVRDWADPHSLAEYLYKNYFTGDSGPLGDVILNGTDLAHVDESYEQWDQLVEAINSSTTERKIYISGAPRCDVTALDSAIETGLFDYLWVLYYDQSAPCEYLGNGNFNNLLESWAKWTSKSGLANSSVFLGLVASPEQSAASSGYISPDELKSNVLPNVTESSNFGGVMIWNRYYDKETGYSAEIKDDLGTKTCECVCQVSPSRRFNSLLAKSV